MNIDEMSVRDLGTYIFPLLTLYTIYMQIELPKFSCMLIRCNFGLMTINFQTSNNASKQQPLVVQQMTFKWTDLFPCDMVDLL